MYKLQNLNVVRVVADELSRDNLLSQGFKLVNEVVKKEVVEVSEEPKTEVKKTKNSRKSVK